MSDFAMPGPEAPGPPVVTLFESYGSGARLHRRAGGGGARLALPRAGVLLRRSSRGTRNRGRRRGCWPGCYAAMGSSSFGGVDVGDVSSAQRDNYDLVMENTATVQQWAHQGGVIVGRNGAFILADWPAALHVKLDAPLEQRIARAAQEAGISPDRAARRQKNEDQIRADMSIELYGWDPRDPPRYDLVVNTGRMDLDTCVEIIVQATRTNSLAGRGARHERPRRHLASTLENAAQPHLPVSRILGYGCGDAGLQHRVPDDRAVPAHLLHRRRRPRSPPRRPASSVSSSSGTRSPTCSPAGWSTAR